ncbi:ROK family protein|nr:ROK family protein [Candidatus Pantoea persica]
MYQSVHLGWRDVDLLSPIRKKVALPLRVMNNVKASALLAVQQLGLEAASSHFYLCIADGVGGALGQQGQVVIGNSWTAGVKRGTLSCSRMARAVTADGRAASRR